MGEIAFTEENEFAPFPGMGEWSRCGLCGFFPNVVASTLADGRVYFSAHCVGCGARGIRAPLGPVGVDGCGFRAAEMCRVEWNHPSVN